MGDEYEQTEDSYWIGIQNLYAGSDWGEIGIAVQATPDDLEILGVLEDLEYISNISTEEYNELESRKRERYSMHQDAVFQSYSVFDGQRRAHLEQLSQDVQALSPDKVVQKLLDDSPKSVNRYLTGAGADFAVEDPDTGEEVDVEAILDQEMFLEESTVIYATSKDDLTEAIEELSFTQVVSMNTSSKPPSW